MEVEDLTEEAAGYGGLPRLPLSVRDPRILGVCLSSRRNVCIHSEVSSFDNRNKVDALCRNLTASFIREQAAQGVGVPVCEFFEGFEREAKESSLLGVYSLSDLKALGREKGWCPYFYARYAISLANVVVYNYQYMLDPKISSLVSHDMEKESIVVFDEAHNIDNIAVSASTHFQRRRTPRRVSRDDKGRLTATPFSPSLLCRSRLCRCSWTRGR